MRVLSAAEMRQVDRAAIEEYGIPGIVLMEHAARAVANVVAEKLPPDRTAIVVCGTGNNAGDGWAAARLLHLTGHAVRVVALRESTALSGDAAVMARAYERIGGPVTALPDEGLGANAGDVVVDAIFGTGLDRPPEGIFHRAIEAIHAARLSGATVIAADLPSGLSADTGRAPGVAVVADLPVTFGWPKLGLVLYPGADLAGELKVAEISIPPQALVPLAPPTSLLTDEDVRALLSPRPRDAHKGTFGHCLVVAGSADKPGAAALAARGALVGGAGLVTVAARGGALHAILGHAPEVMGLPLAGDGPLSLEDFEALAAGCEGRSSLLVGPGIPRGEETGELIARLLENAECPVVLDADALNAIAGRPELLERARHDVIVTPHPGEMARLVGTTIAEVQDDRVGIARRLAGERGCLVVLKGARTVIAAPDGAVAIGATGNPGLATGGTGDVLGGLCAALLAQKLPAGAAAAVAVHVHGLAADRMVKERGERGLTASDVIAGIGAVWADWGL